MLRSHLQCVVGYASVGNERAGTLIQAIPFAWLWTKQHKPSRAARTWQLLTLATSLLRRPAKAGDEAVCRASALSMSLSHAALTSGSGSYYACVSIKARADLAQVTLTGGSQVTVRLLSADQLLACDGVRS